MVILQKRIEGLSETALDRFVMGARRAAGVKGTINVLVTSSAVLRSLNHRFRGRNQATDVLSFPAQLPKLGKGSRMAGEIAISADIAVQNALRFGHGAAQEIKILALHGILHLAGFDHERDNGKMARKETALREKLGLPSGLIERANLPDERTLERKRKVGARRSA